VENYGNGKTLDGSIGERVAWYFVTGRRPQRTAQYLADFWLLFGPQKDCKDLGSMSRLFSLCESTHDGQNDQGEIWSAL